MVARLTLISDAIAVRYDITDFFEQSFGHSLPFLYGTHRVFTESSKEVRILSDEYMHQTLTFFRVARVGLVVHFWCTEKNCEF